MNLGKKIIALRKKEKLSQESFADILGVTRQTISNWELNVTKPDIKQVKEISKKFHLSIDELVDNDIQNVIVSKIDNTEKLVNKNTKILLIIIYFVLLISLISITIYLLTKKDFTKEYQSEFYCTTKDKQIFNIAVEKENINENDNEENSENYIIISIYENGQYNTYDRHYAGKSLSETFESLKIVKKVMIEEYHAKCR